MFASATDRVLLRHGTNTATVLLKGAELCSLFSATRNREYIWQAGAEWPKHAPVLFPIVGQLMDNRYRYENKWYEMGRHGYARDSLFTVKEQSDHSVVLELKDSESTREKYPFRFSLQLEFKLDQTGLHASAKVENAGTRQMPFSYGAHPAFWLPGATQKKWAGYSVNFDRNVTLMRIPLSNGLLSGRPEVLLADAQSIPLHSDSFTNDAWVIPGPPFSGIRISEDGIQGPWQLKISDCSHFGIWTRPGADFLCLEPWWGVADRDTSDGEISKKEGIILLEPGQSRQFSYAVEWMD